MYIIDINGLYTFIYHKHKWLIYIYTAYSTAIHGSSWFLMVISGCLDVPQMSSAFRQGDSLFQHLQAVLLPSPMNYSK